MRRLQADSEIPLVSKDLLICNRPSVPFLREVGEVWSCWVASAIFFVVEEQLDVLSTISTSGATRLVLAIWVQSESLLLCPFLLSLNI